MSQPPRKSAFPTAPVSVTVVFRGLLTFCFDGATGCEAGVLQTDPFFPGQEHDLTFRKWTKAMGRCPSDPDPLPIYPKPLSSFELRVNGSIPEVNGVFVLERDPFIRVGTGNHPNDFRWMIDFESDLYDVQVPKIPGRVGPRLTIDRGVFYTHHTTLTKFNAHPSTGSGQVKLRGGSIAEVMAARIYLDAGGSVDVIVDGQLVDTLRQGPGLEYQIDVFNLCSRSSHPDCDYLPAHPTDKTKRNDFYMYYNTINTHLRSGGVEEYHLMAVIPTSDSEIRGICKRAPEFGTDPAPCGPVGFRQTFPFP